MTNNNEEMNYARGKFRGRLMVAPVTPFAPDGSLHLGFIAKQAATMLHRGVEGFYVGGRSGEGVSLSVTERMQLAECWRQSADRSIVIVNVDHACLADACRLAAHAADIGADGISGGGGHASYPTSRIADLIEWCARVSGAAENLPYFFYYYTGSTPGLVNPNPLTLCQEAVKRIPNFSGLKYSHEALKGVMDCEDFQNGKLDVLYGRDEMMLGALAMGATSVIGGTFNLLSPLGRAILTAWGNGQWEKARGVQRRMNRCISILGHHGGLVAVKAAMPLIGLECGPARQPLRQLSRDETSVLRRELETVEPQLWKDGNGESGFAAIDEGFDWGKTAEMQGSDGEVQACSSAELK
jgi:N-acetylneuraminate lyase